MNWKQISEEVHANAVEHGWWEKERGVSEVIVLCHSELSEALEEYRKSKQLNEIYFIDGKPEGIPIELADCVIRLLDWCSFIGTKYFDMIDVYSAVSIVKFDDYEDDVKYDGSFNDGKWFNEAFCSFFDFIMACHSNLSYYWVNNYSFRQNDEHELKMCIVKIVRFFKLCGLSLEETLYMKHEYNKNRPYRHGNKLA